MDEQQTIEILNQIFEIEKKIQGSPLEKGIQRNINRMKMQLENSGYRYHNPLGESYDITRLDCEAMVAGEGAQQLKIVEVIKPIIYHQTTGNTIIQKGIVITEQT